MDNAIQIFNNPEFGQVRTITHNGEIWFVGKDVAEALGYQNGSRDINRHVDQDDRIKEMIAQYQNGTVVKTQTILINESGLYSLILGSKLSSAKHFKHWVTSEVLPSIRKTGSYVLSNKQDMEKYIARRIGIEMRKGMTEAIKEAVPESTHKKFAYPNYTNLVYKTVFSMNTKQLKQDRELEKDANIREHLSAEELMKVKMIEDLVKNYLYAGLEYEQIKNVLRATFPDGVKLIYQVANNKRIA